MTQSPDLFDRLYSAIQTERAAAKPKQQETDVTVTTLRDVRPSVSTTPKRASRSVPYFGFQSFSI